MKIKSMILALCLIVISAESAIAYDVRLEDTVYYVDYLSHYNFGTTIKPVVTPTWYTKHSAEEWYAIYLSYCMDINPPDVEIIGFGTYAEYIRYWEKLIPYQFLYPLVNESLKQNVPMRYLYAISCTETCGYRFFESLKPNENGTIDVGLMGFNSRNFDTSTPEGVEFLKTYFYFDDEYLNVPFNSHNQLHIVKVCTRFLKVINSRTTKGSFRSAAICYNGGSRRWQRGTPSKDAVIYGERVYTLSRKHIGFTPLVKSTVSSHVLSSFQRIREIQTTLEGISRSSMFNSSYTPLDRYRAKIALLELNRVNLNNLDMIFAFGTGMGDFLFDRESLIVKETCYDIGIFLGMMSEDGMFIILS